MTSWKYWPLVFFFDGTRRFLAYRTRNKHVWKNVFLKHDRPSSIVDSVQVESREKQLFNSRPRLWSQTSMNCSIANDWTFGRLARPRLLQTIWPFKDGGLTQDYSLNCPIVNDWTFGRRWVAPDYGLRPVWIVQITDQSEKWQTIRKSPVPA